MKDFMFVDGKNGINFNEWLYLKDMFKLLKCGVELEFEFEESMRYSHIENALGRINRSYETFGVNTSGVAKVTSDGSLEDGVEIVTNGRLFHTPYLHYCQYKRIFDALEWNIERNPRTGMHMHFLLATGNDRSNLEVPLNLLFIKNLMILCKRYLPEMVYLTSSNHEVLSNGNTSITRYSGFSKYDTLYRTDFNSLNTVEELQRQYTNVDGRYQCINLCSMPTDMQDGKTIIENFHVEFRLADGALCPSQVTLIQFMYKGLIELALECSLIGELQDVYSHKQELLSKFKNNPTGSNFPRTESRYSDNTLTDSDFMLLKTNSKLFIDDIKDYIPKDVYIGLQSLVESSVGVRANHYGDSFRQLDEDLNVFKAESGIIDHNVLKSLLSIDTNSLSEVLLTSKENDLNLEEVTKTINLLKKVERFGGKKW